MKHFDLNNQKPNFFDLRTKFGEILNLKNQIIDLDFKIDLQTRILTIFLLKKCNIFT